VQSHRALKLQESGEYVIVYTDESYIHSNHALQNNWFPAGSDQCIIRTRRTGRLVIFHAITKDGLLYKETSPNDADLSIPTKNAEYIYEVEKEKVAAEAGKGKGTVADAEDKKDDKESYHGNIDLPMWFTFFQNRLIPAFKACYPIERIILVMDNATYHMGREEGWKSPSSMRKAEVAEALKKYGITSFEVERTKKNGEVVRMTFDEQMYDLPRGGPLVKEMNSRLSRHLKLNPHLIPDRTAQELAKMGGVVLFTPPMEPFCQPIELTWGMMKGYPADLYSLGRTMEETRQQLLKPCTSTCGRRGQGRRRRRRQWEKSGRVTAKE
jgi:hypothetical protein